jgi:hypothetical protein
VLQRIPTILFTTLLFGSPCGGRNAPETRLERRKMLATERRNAGNLPTARSGKSGHRFSERPAQQKHLQRTTANHQAPPRGPHRATAPKRCADADRRSARGPAGVRSGLAPSSCRVPLEQGRASRKFCPQGWANPRPVQPTVATRPLSTVTSGSLALALASLTHTYGISGSDFSATLITVLFDRSSWRWFEIST